MLRLNRSLGMWNGSAVARRLIRPRRSANWLGTERTIVSAATFRRIDARFDAEVRQARRTKACFLSTRSSAVVEPISNTKAYRYLNLKTFSVPEIEVLFDRIAGEKDVVDEENLQAYLVGRIRELEAERVGFVAIDEDATDAQRHAFALVKASSLMAFLMSEAQGPLTKPIFVEAVRNRASKIDFKKSLPITASMLLVGSSVGIMTPAMPFIVAHLQLTSGQYGLVVSAFALAKMIGNVPSAIGVDLHGRKPYMIYSLALVAASTAGIGAAESFNELYLCRLMTGFGVAALSTSATMMLTDISTPLNRASTLAPIMSAFSAGAALGPAMGGVLVDTVGLHRTFFVVGLSFLGVSVFNRAIMSETRPDPIRFPWQIEAAASKSDGERGGVTNAVYGAVSQWAPLMRNPSVRNVMFLNTMYWVALAGSQMTILPLMLTDPAGLAFSATQVGQVYMGMSLVQIFGNPIFAQFADRMGKVPAMIGGCFLISASMAGLTFCTDTTQLAAALGTWAVGSSMLSTAPVAYISDKVSDSKRAQALALLRTWGDVGFLIGASSTGALADWTGSLDVAMQSSSALLMMGTVWFATRQAINARIVAEK